METSRRGFLKFLGIGVAGAVAAKVVSASSSLLDIGLDPEKALWVPGAKTFFIPTGDIAVKNIREATMAEVGQLTGTRMLRIKSGNDIQLMSEREFDQVGHVAYPQADQIHFDDGTIAYNFRATGRGNLEAARASAHAYKKQNQNSEAAKHQRQRESLQLAGWTKYTPPQPQDTERPRDVDEDDIYIVKLK